MNHREFVQSLYPTQAPAMVMERELDYRPALAADATLPQIGQQILQSLGLEGTHRVSGGKDGKPLVIERQEFRGATFLERMHRRRGYQQPYALEDTWAFSVDVAVVAMVIWSLSSVGATRARLECIQSVGPQSSSR
jgi:hypothetical protein